MVNLTENPGARGQLQRNRYPQQGKFFFWKSPLLQENCCHRKAEQNLKKKYNYLRKGVKIKIKKNKVLKKLLTLIKQSMELL